MAAQFEALLLMPLIGAAIGYLTNVIAIKMLFWPRRPRRLLKLRIQGVIPAKREEIATRLSTALMDYIRREDIASLLSDAVRRGALREYIERKVMTAITAVPAPMPWTLLTPLIARIISPAIAQGISGIISREISSQFSTILTSHIDLEGWIKKRTSELTADEIESVFKKIASRELRFIELAGALIGGVIGLLQAILLTLL